MEEKDIKELKNKYPELLDNLDKVAGGNNNDQVIAKLRELLSNLKEEYDNRAQQVERYVTSGISDSDNMLGQYENRLAELKIMIENIEDYLANLK